MFRVYMVKVIYLFNIYSKVYSINQKEKLSIYESHS